MSSLPGFIRRGLLLGVCAILIAGCKNNPPDLIHNFPSDTLNVNHGVSLDLDLRFIDDRNELVNARVDFNGKEIYNGADTIFKFILNTGKLKAGDYILNMNAIDTDEKEADKELFIRVNAMKPLLGDLSIINVRATEATLLFNIKSMGGVAMIEKGVRFKPVGTGNSNWKKILIKNNNLTVKDVVDGFPRKSKLLVQAYVQNSIGITYTNSVEIDTKDGIPRVITKNVDNIHSTSVRANGTVITDGGANLTGYGICYGTDPNPSIKDKIEYGKGRWALNLELTNLTQFTRYYYRSFARNRYATVYGEIKEFETTGPPTVITGKPGRIMVSSIAFSIDVTEDGGHEVTESGIVYSMLKEPTIDNNVFNLGMGTGKHHGVVTNLDPGSKYFLRAYAANSEGVAYGEEVVLFTKIGIPVVNIQGISKIDYSSVNLVADVPDDGGLDIIERGIAWDTISRPTKANKFATVPGNSGSFEFCIPNLKSGVKYYARAYALNERGIVYSEPVGFIPYINMEMADIPGGSFSMGSEKGDKTEKPVHQVTLSSYQIGKYEVSNLEFAAFLNSNLKYVNVKGGGDIVSINGIPVYHLKVYGEDYVKTNFQVHIAFDGEKFFVNNDCSSFPAVLVTWEGARMFCEWAGGRLPTEAEWEYAAKGATNNSARFAGGDDPDKVAWYYKNSKGADCALMQDSRGLYRSGQREANKIGLYDMSGNAAEWCKDVYSNSYYTESSLVDPAGPEKGLFRVIRGGSWADREDDCTVYRRIKSFDINRGYDNIGFRLVRKKKD